MLPKYLYGNYQEFDETKDSIYYSTPYWDNKEVDAAVSAITDGKWLCAGSQVNKFEVEFCKKFNQKFGVMLNSGSSANLVMLAAFKFLYGLKDDDEIILSSVGFPTTISAVIYNRLKPVFIDVSLNDINFDISKIEAKITNRTKAIFLSSVLGNPPSIDKLQDLLYKHNLFLLNDDCDSLGTEWCNKYLSDYALASTYSFFPSHQLAIGQGGLISSNNEELIKIARSFINWGKDCWCVGAANLLPNGSCNTRWSKWIDGFDEEIDHKYFWRVPGFNFGIMDLQGAIGLEQLKKIDKIISGRINSYDRLKQIFSTNPNIRVIEKLPQAITCWFGLPIWCTTPQIKQQLVKYLESHRISTRSYFGGNNLMHPAFSQYGNYKEYPNANLVLSHMFFIGVDPRYTDKVFNYIEKVFKEFNV